MKTEILISVPRQSIFIYFIIYLLVSLRLLTHSSCRVLVLQLTHLVTQTLSRTPLDYWSVRRKDLYLTTHYNRKRQRATPLAEFEPAILRSERLQTAWLPRSAMVHHWVQTQNPQKCTNIKFQISLIAILPYSTSM